MGTVDALEWLYKKGKDELSEEHYESARKRFQKILSMTRDSTWVERANASLAEVYLVEDNLFWAMDHVCRALKRAPNNPRYRYVKGSIHLKRQEWGQAASEALKAVEEELANGDYYQLLGKATYHCDGYETARRFFEWAIQCKPEDVEIRMDLVRIEIEEGNFQKALKILKQALEETPQEERIRKKMRVIQEHWEITGS